MSPRREQWRRVAGFPAYEVSDLGRVRTENRGRAIVLQPSTQSKGYPIVNFGGGKRGTQKTKLVHLLVLEAFRGPRPAGHRAAFESRDRRNVRLSNLRWRPDKERAAHFRELGVDLDGVKNGNARLSWEDIVEIRRRSAAGESYAAIARSYRVQTTTVRSIVLKISWKTKPADEPASVERAAIARVKAKVMRLAGDREHLLAVRSTPCWPEDAEARAEAVCTALEALKGLEPRAALGVLDRVRDLLTEPTTL